MAEPSRSIAAPLLNAQTQYKARFTGEILHLPATCNEKINIDLDEARVRAEEGISELTYYDMCGTQTAYITLGNGVDGSEVESESVTPTECADRIRTSPLSAGNQPVRRGQVFCLTTSRSAAANAAIPWKLVVITITGSEQDGAATIKESAWDIPG